MLFTFFRNIVYNDWVDFDLSQHILFQTFYKLISLSMFALTQ